MDLNKLTDISVWDVRNVYNKVKNVVMNYTEMEIKVNEATGPEPWGASSTLMREIADATFISKQFDEIMPAIYMKFNDTDPSNWRQVYKALQLIEYLVKSGSERVVDDVRGHVTIVKMLKNFHHIDANGKDQGINVRQRSREIVELVQNSDRVREERQRAKDNRDKYSGYSNEGSTRAMEGFGGGGKYAGFGSESIGRGASKYTGFGSDGYRPSAGLYDNGSDAGSNPWSGNASRNASSPAVSSGPSSRKPTRQGTPAAPAKPVEPVVADLFSFDEDEDANGTLNIAPISAPVKSTTNTADLFAAFVPPAAAKAAKAASPAKAADDDDDWGDFQCSGSSTTTSFAASKQPPALSQPVAKNPSTASAAAVDLLGGDDFAPVAFQPLATTGAAQRLPMTTVNSTATGATSTSSALAKDKAAQKNAFSDIWDMGSGLVSLDSLSLTDKNKSATGNARAGTTMNQLSGQQKGTF
ncbi:Epsin-3, clathrin recruitment and traffic between the Golgi and endosome [Coemansia sp. RSA 2050]|nr:Epsin-3, clathrin recruitment and traffic between the Golgi and endosome [Coemansia sp. RSA 2050]KAJ2731792.1 Epsin-3, clathrin recruitment and traffic between the Golgi and endosome [Coemansia sp. BCRC 34962]